MLGGLSAITKIPELKRRITLTLLFLAVFRIGVYVPTPGINAQALSAFFAGQQGTLFSFFDMFSGGALSQLSIFALGIMPYISASIIIQLLTVVIPHLDRLSKEGDEGRKKITQYTRWGTVGLSLIQGMFIALGLEGMRVGEMSAVAAPGWYFRFMTTLTLTAGTAFLMWLGEQITEKGIGNGISLIIFAGIVANMPSAIAKTSSMVKEGAMSPFIMMVLLVMMLAVVAAIIYVETAQRRIPVQYAKRIIGRRIYGGQSTHLPLKVNTAGVIPPIFASSIIMFPATIANFVNVGWIKSISAALAPGRLAYTIIYVGSIIFFCYFYTAVTFNPVDVADNMRKHGGYIPGYRPGKSTSDFIDRVLTRITFGGAIYVSAVCVLPTFLITSYRVPFYFGGTSLLIVVGVAIDTMAQIEAHLLTRHYEGFMKTTRRR